MPDAETTMKIEAFLKELGELCAKHRMELGSCSCCDGINLYSADGEHLGPVNVNADVEKRVVTYNWHNQVTERNVSF